MMARIAAAFLFFGGAVSAFNPVVRPVFTQRSSSTLNAEPVMNRRTALLQTLTVASFASPALALRSVLSEEEEEMLRKKDVKEAAIAANKEKAEAFMAGETTVTTPRPTKKMKWQQEIDEKKAEEAASSPTDDSAMRAMREKRAEKKAAAAEKIKSRKRNCTAVEEMQGKC